VAIAAPAVGQTLPAQNQEILNELRQIRLLLEKLAGPVGQPVGAQPAPAAAPADRKARLAEVTGFVLGRPDAPLTMVEFTDLQCPFCRQYHSTTFEQLKRDYIDTGKLRYIHRDFPLEAIHPLAKRAMWAAHCAADGGKFWEMRHTILVNNASLTPDSFHVFAKDLGLDARAFRSCLDDAERFKTALTRDAAEGSGAGVSGTPSFVIGRTTASGLDGALLVGAQPYSVFEGKLRELLTGR
jgi:protein-disulfide isomerase